MNNPTRVMASVLRISRARRAKPRETSRVLMGIRHIGVNLLFRQHLHVLAAVKTTVSTQLCLSKNVLFLADGLEILTGAVNHRFKQVMLLPLAEGLGMDDALGGEVQVVYFKGNEKRRLWTFKQGSHPKTILRGLTITIRGTERFFNPGIVPLLLRDRPRFALLATCIKDPTFWLAAVVLRLLGTRIALLEDTWSGRDRGIGPLQKLARRTVYRAFGDAFVGTSRQALALYRHYHPRIGPEQESL